MNTLSIKLRSSKSGSHALLHTLFDLAESRFDLFEVKRLDAPGSSPNDPNHMSFSFYDKTNLGLPWTLIFKQFDAKDIIISVSDEDASLATEDESPTDISKSLTHLHDLALSEKREEIGTFSYVID